MGGGNSKGIFALIDFDWQTQDALDTPVRWHCGDPEIDPWEWRFGRIVLVFQSNVDNLYVSSQQLASGHTKAPVAHVFAQRHASDQIEDPGKI